MYIPTMEVNPVKTYVPEELTERRLSYGDAVDLKLGMEDSELEMYYRTGGNIGENNVEVLEIGEASSYSNVKLPDRVIEKTPPEDKMVREISYGILGDELGTGPELLYVREKDGEIRYGMEYLADAGQFKDINFNGFRDFLDYAQAVGQAYGSLYAADIVHEDLIGMRRGPPELRHTPYLRNIMVSGDDDEATIIDFEDAHFEGETSPKCSDGNHILEMEPENTDDEYDALRAGLLSEALNGVDYIHEKAERPIVKQDLLGYDQETGLDYVDFNKLQQRDVYNEDVDALIVKMEERFEEGWANATEGCSRSFCRNQQQSTIERNHGPQRRLRDAARARLKQDIEPTVERWINELQA